jgi:hypothetical protein
MLEQGKETTPFVLSSRLHLCQHIPVFRTWAGLIIARGTFLPQLTYAVHATPIVTYGEETWTTTKKEE